MPRELMNGIREVVRLDKSVGSVFTRGAVRYCTCTCTCTLYGSVALRIRMKDCISVLLATS